MMPQPERQWNQETEANTDRLHSALDKLRARSEQHVQSKYGLSGDFSKSVDSEERAMALCEEAMSTLAGPYVDNLVAFRDATNPMDALRALESAETLWQGESAVITHLDASGEEQKFLGTVRRQAHTVIANKLEEVARDCRIRPSDENIALCLALLGVLDKIQEEFGIAPDQPERQRLRMIAQSFNS